MTFRVVSVYHFVVYFRVAWRLSVCKARQDPGTKALSLSYAAGIVDSTSNQAHFQVGQVASLERRRGEEKRHRQHKNATSD